jgi:hypothetical protein
MTTSKFYIYVREKGNKKWKSVGKESVRDLSKVNAKETREYWKKEGFQVRVIPKRKKK